MSIFRKAKKFLGDTDDTHDRLVAGVHRVFDDEDELVDRREEARETLNDIRQEELDEEEDDGRLIRFPNPGRNWTEKKNERFLELTNTPEVQQLEEERARIQQARAAYTESPTESSYEHAEAAPEGENTPDYTNYTLVRYKRRKGTW